MSASSHVNAAAGNPPSDSQLNVDVTLSRRATDGAVMTGIPGGSVTNKMKY